MSSCVTCKIRRSPSTTILPNSPVLHCLNLTSSFCCRFGHPPRLQIIPAGLNSVPDWIRPFLWLLWVHLGAVMGRRVAPGAFFWMLRVGIFVVWFPAVLVAQRLVGNLNRRDLWKVVLKGSPDWMRYMVYVFFVYAFVNFLLFIGKTPSGSSGTNPPASVWRGFSGHWMSLYSAVLAILYTGARAVDTSPRCGNGHSALPNSTYCPKCGQPVMRVR